MGDLTKNFNRRELQCPCCGLMNMDSGTVGRLQLARDIAGIPFKINSASRCEKHNREVGGVAGSAHLHGFAVDVVAIQSATRMLVLRSLLAAGFERIGIAKTFIHADRDLDLPGDVVWLYEEK